MPADGAGTGWTPITWGLSRDVVAVSGGRRHRPPRPAGRDDPGRARRRGGAGRAAGRQLPGRAGGRRADVVGVQPGQAQRRVRVRRRACSSSSAPPTSCSTTASSTRTSWPPLNPALVHVSITRVRRATGPKAGWAASDLTVLAAGCAQALNGDERPGARSARRCPRPGCTPAPRRRSARCSPSPSASAAGRGQHVDVSAQQAVMQAGIPGVLLAPNDNPEAQRTSGGILAGPSTCSSSTRPATATSRSRCCSAR